MAEETLRVTAAELAAGKNPETILDQAFLGAKSRSEQEINAGATAAAASAPGAASLSKPPVPGHKKPESPKTLSRADVERELGRECRSNLIAISAVFVTTFLVTIALDHTLALAMFFGGIVSLLFPMMSTFKSGTELTSLQMGASLHSYGPNLQGHDLDARRDVDLPALLKDRQALLVGENHFDFGHYRAIADSLVELKKAGLTHIAVELPQAPLYRILRPLIDLGLPMRSQVWLLSQLLGIKTVHVDGDMENFDERNQHMAAAIKNILLSNPEAKILFPVGTAHLDNTRDPASKKEFWVQNLLRKEGISTLPVLSMNVRQTWWLTDSEAARAIWTAGLKNEAFFVPYNDPGAFQGVLHFPESTAWSWLPRPWAAAKRWLKAFGYLLGISGLGK